MSYGGTAPAWAISLLGEVEDLRREVSAVDTKLDQVLALLQGDRAEDQISLGSFELFETSNQARGSNRGSNQSGASASAGVQLPLPVQGTTSSSQSWEEREAISKEVGKYLSRALAGGHRGNSGRDKIKLASRLYIIVRDFSGNVFRHPVKILSKFSDVKLLCSRQGDFGDSVFVGLPSLREARVCVASAGFSWPDDL